MAPFEIRLSPQIEDLARKVDEFCLLNITIKNVDVNIVEIEQRLNTKINGLDHRFGRQMDVQEEQPTTI